MGADARTQGIHNLIVTTLNRNNSLPHDEG